MDWEEMFAHLPPRTFDGLFFGDDAPGIELAALEEAEYAFGPGVALAVIPVYQMHWTSLDQAEVTGKRYCAYVVVAARDAVTPQAPS